MTLDQAVHFVIRVLELAKGGEIFVPKIPSMKIVDLAKAIAPECSQEIVGIRPGEKIHETLIGEDEGRNSSEYKECFIVRSNQAEDNHTFADEEKPCPEGFTYRSDNNPDMLSIKDLRVVLDQISEDDTLQKTWWSMDDVPQ